MEPNPKRRARRGAIAVSLCAALGLSTAVAVAASPEANQSIQAGNPPAAPQAPPAPAPEGRYVTRSGTAMGTFVQIRAYLLGPPAPADEGTVGPKLDRALAEIRRLEGLMTTWRPESEISRLNAAAGKEAVAVSPEVYEVLAASLRYAKLSGGAFDISFYALKGLWHFDDDLTPTLPPAGEIARRLRLIDWRQIALDPQQRTAQLRRAGMAVNLGGIGKGYAVDAAVKVLRREGIASGMVQAGGDLMLFGSKGGQPFMAGVRDPRSPDPGDYFAVCPVKDHAFSTAGDYERSFIKDGKRYHHILDPRTGYPAAGARSVTVFAKDATTADGLDDAILILGVEKGLALIESIPDAGAIIVDNDNKVHVSRRLQKLVRIVHPPTPGI